MNNALPKNQQAAALEAPILFKGMVPTRMVPPRPPSWHERLASISNGSQGATHEDWLTLNDLLSICRKKPANETETYLSAVLNAGISLLKRTTSENPNAVKVIRSLAYACSKTEAGEFLLQTDRFMKYLDNDALFDLSHLVRSTFAAREAGYVTESDPAYQVCLRLLRASGSAWLRSRPQEIVRQDYTRVFLADQSSAFSGAHISHNDLWYLDFSLLPYEVQMQAMTAWQGAPDGLFAGFVPKHAEDALLWLEVMSRNRHINYGCELLEATPSAEMLKLVPERADAILAASYDRISASFVATGGWTYINPLRDLTRAILGAQREFDMLVTSLVGPLQELAAESEGLAASGVGQLLANETLPLEVAKRLCSIFAPLAKPGMAYVTRRNPRLSELMPTLLADGWLTFDQLAKKDMTDKLVLPILAAHPERLAEIKDYALFTRFAQKAGIRVSITEADDDDDTDSAVVRERMAGG